MRVKKNCGSCTWFRKLRSLGEVWALCEFDDARTKSDNGHNCKNWKGIKYERNKVNRTDVSKCDHVWGTAFKRIQRCVYCGLNR